MTADDRDLLIRIDAKLTIVCGEHGDGGVLAEHGREIRALQDENTLKAGAHSVKAWGAILTGMTALLTSLWSVFHGK